MVSGNMQGRDENTSLYQISSLFSAAIGTHALDDKRVETWYESIGQWDVGKGDVVETERTVALFAIEVRMRICAVAFVFVTA